MAYYIPGTRNLDMEEMYWHARDPGYVGDVFIMSKYDGTLHKKAGMDENAYTDDDVSMHSEVDESPPDVMFRKKDQKDAELDKKIEALRKKNEALMKRYQEVEEDKKRAEEEGMALQSRQGKAEDLTITINKSTSETRVVTKKSVCGDAVNARGVQEAAEPNVNRFSMGRGKRRQLLVTMAGDTKGRRVVSEKRAQNQPTSPGGMREVSEEEDLECVRMGKHLQPSKPDSRPQEDEGRQQCQGLIEEGQWLAECDPYFKEDVEGPVPQSHTDLTIPTSREEQLEYLRWKKEREQIDRERVARHKNAMGQWRRAWDMDKSENMFRDRFHGESERGNKTRGGRNARRGQSRATGESQGLPYRNRDEGGKNLPAVSSKAKGKDRLTGRARRWDAKEEDEHLQTMDTSLEEFLEELDAFVGLEVDLSPKPQAEIKEDDVGKDLSHAAGADAAGADEAVGVDDPERGGFGPVESDRGQRDDTSAVDAASGPPAASPGGSVAKPRRAPEKKVRFSEETVKETKGTEEVVPSPVAPSEVPGPAKGSSPGRGSLSVVTEEALRTPASGSRGPERDAMEKEDQEASDLPHSSAPVSSVLVGDDTDGPGPEDTSLTDMVEKKPNDAQGLTSQPESDLRTTDGKLAALTGESAHQPLRHSKNTRSPEEMINSSLSLTSLDSGAPHPYHETANAKVKENGKIV